jgi:hypothetical protein
MPHRANIMKLNRYLKKLWKSAEKHSEKKIPKFAML